MVLNPLSIPLIQVGGAKTCLKLSQKCNFFAECDPLEGSDTAEDELDCDEKYRKKRPHTAVNPRITMKNQ